jgi:hypothetical protein
MIEPFAVVGFGDDRELRDEVPSDFNPYRLWSLWEMLEVFAIHYIELGRLIEAARVNFQLSEACDPDEPGTELNQREIAELRDTLGKILRECRALGLRTATRVVAKAMGDLPETEREFAVIIETVKGEIASKRFLYIPDYRSAYFNLDLPQFLTEAFPFASREMFTASRSVSVGLSTACVFHAMRAAELGVRALANELGGITFSVDISLVEWAQILDKIDARIREMKQLPRGTKKDEDLQFYSEAASQFRYFKDGWRVRVAHARATYDKQQAVEVLNHTLSFFRTLAIRGLKE